MIPLTSSLKLPRVMEVRVVVMLDRVEEEMEGDRCQFESSKNQMLRWDKTTTGLLRGNT